MSRGNSATLCAASAAFLWNVALLVPLLLCSAAAAFQFSEEPLSNGYDFEMADLLGLSERAVRFKRQPSLRNSASQFLLQVYNEINEDEDVENVAMNRRYKRDLQHDNFITPLDRAEIAKCNNIVTFSSRPPQALQYRVDSSDANTPTANMLLNFNTNDVPRDLALVQSALRIYQSPQLGIFGKECAVHARRMTISVYQRNARQPRLHAGDDLRLLTYVNSTTCYQGWLEFNVTRLLAKWLQYPTLQQVLYGNELLLGVIIAEESESTAANPAIAASSVGLVGAAAQPQFVNLQPFIIGYFNGPELMAKIQKLRFRRSVARRKRRAGYYRPPPSPIEIYRLPKSCERLNFTLDFRDLQMHNWVIAPKKFEAYFCGGDCNFPLASRMNATNHAIVQTLMHLKQPHLPKACCVPIKLGAISILHYLNEDSVNLSKYPQSVAKECGCH